ncbi:MAG TPA: 16S rRNA (adenine(1518)-N(6)/adenine(1519)-N(6))-dimethyltransferase RsmA [Candidatus Acidoferrum sp.]|nr:16S rRNA (adenine(1518)-N(6)/adenine(1519)-N(6))-dimethyltransferase RsmA [Candidatus Acidoferrum sp.]
MNLCDRATIARICKKYGFQASKGLGQNFLIDPAVPRRIAETVPEGYGALEIGPGLGCLTVELARRAAKVAAVELDRALLPVLAETVPQQNVTVVHGDFMKLSVPELLAEHLPGLPVAVAANLPYYITTPIVMKLLESPVEQVTVMVQKEVAERLCAPPGGDESGAITLAVAWRAKAEYLFEVPAASFWPAPKVDSAVVKLTLREPPVAVQDEALMFRLVKAGFAQRRKTLTNALKSAGYDPATAAFLPAGIRAERLTLAQWAALADAYCAAQA